MKGILIEKHPEQLWNECKDFSGIDEGDFFDYFRGKDKGFAIEIGDVEAFDPINPKDHIPDFVPPQSFCYTDKHWAGVVGVDIEKSEDMMTEQPGWGSAKLTSGGGWR